MDNNHKIGLAGLLNESVIFDAAMSSYTTLRVGGKAEAICFIDNLQSLKNVVSYMDNELVPWIAIGKGSNLLVTDKGIKGAIIILKGELAQIRIEGSNIVTAGGGVSISELMRYCVREELSGIEFLAGIPGTVGGAVIMNAGAYGEETGCFVEKIDIVTSGGKIKELSGSGISFTYRKTSIPESSVIYSVTLRLKKEKRELIKRGIEKNLSKRNESQPLDMPSCGSVFKNPPGEYAAKLIEASGLKGMRIGGAMISPKHANFIVNTGDATASDILSLIEVTRNKVRELSGILLETEVRVIGQ